MTIAVYQVPGVGYVSETATGDVYQLPGYVFIAQTTSQAGGGSPVGPLVKSKLTHGGILLGGRLR